MPSDLSSLVASDALVRRTRGPARTNLPTVQTHLRQQRSTAATTVQKILVEADLHANLARKMPKESICVKPSTATENGQRIPRTGGNLILGAGGTLLTENVPNDLSRTGAKLQETQRQNRTSLGSKAQRLCLQPPAAPPAGP